MHLAIEKWVDHELQAWILRRQTKRVTELFRAQHDHIRHIALQM